MTAKLPADLGPVPETLLIPLYARAELTRQGSDLIRDPKAVETVEAIAYDFSKFDGMDARVEWFCEEPRNSRAGASAWNS